tara:strand:+ start:40 stop:249 length:210 start_codon:yes stop_codon:yes gene_type:complete
MSTRAERLEGEYLKTLYLLGKTTTDKKMTIGAKSLGAFTRAIVDECPTMSLKVAKELYAIADELDDLHK